MTGPLVAAGLAAGLIVTGTAIRGSWVEPFVPTTAAPLLQPSAVVAPRRVAPSFEPNLGQWGEGISFVARGRGWRSQVSPAHNRMVVTDGRINAAVTVSIEGGRATARPQPFGLKRAFSACFFGTDPARWQRHVRVANAAGVTNCTSSGQRYVLIPQPFGTQALTVEFVKTGALLAPTYVPVVVVNGQP
jgi:hypothetical protein